MPKGGKRAGAGRPPGSLNKRHKVVVADPSALMPVEWMLAVLRDPECEPQRRDQMAIQAAPYLHPRLAMAGVTSTNIATDHGGDVNIVQIFAVPHGASLDVKSGTISVDGRVLDPTPVEPFAATPALTDQSESPRWSPCPC